jgi:hypothetical protein
LVLHISLESYWVKNYFLIWLWMVFQMSFQGSYFHSLKLIFSISILCLVDYTNLSKFVLSTGFSKAPPWVMSLPAVPRMLSTTVKVLCSKVPFWNLYFNQVVFLLILLHLLLVLTILSFHIFLCQFFLIVFCCRLMELTLSMSYWEFQYFTEANRSTVCSYSEYALRSSLIRF